MTRFSRLRSGAAWYLPLLFVITGCSAQNRETPGAASESSAVIGVEEAMRNHGADTTMIAVQGVVQTVSSKEELLTLIDVKEYQACGLSDCCLYMPVRWTGSMPPIEATVTVTGSIQESSAGLVFVASELSESGTSEIPSP